MLKYHYHKIQISILLKIYHSKVFINTLTRTRSKAMELHKGKKRLCNFSYMRVIQKGSSMIALKEEKSDMDTDTY